MAAVVTWFWERYGAGGANAFVGFAASVIGVLGAGGLWPLWKWALLRDNSAGAGADARIRAERRRRLAGNIRRQLIFAYDQGEWSDNQYAELKAEFHVDAILADDIPWWQWFLGRDALLRRERSLTRALQRMRPKIVILEGEPGSGKSVALRHLALKLARHADRRRRADSLLPVYVNLKDFRPATGQVDSESVRRFIYATLVSQDSGVASFLDAEFDDVLKAGSWLLLFDSFDEIPAVLGATEADQAVRDYAGAIINFTENRGFRAVIASREFRGPQGFTLPRLRIVPLTGRQQRALIRRSGMPADMADTAVMEISRAGPDVRQLTDNPLFLWLVCQYLRDNNGVFPESAYSVFDSYVRHRLTADESRLREKFRVEAEEVRSYAEQFAFSMASSPALGLTPATSQLAASVSALPTTSSLQAGRVPAVLDALEYLRLGRYEASPGEPDIRRFTFTHRRLQEYFATCAVFGRPGEVPPQALLTDGHWRETAVAIFQTRPADAVGQLLGVLREMLAPLAAAALQPAERFTWPPGLLHLLDVLAAGLGRTPDRIPDDIRDLAGQVLTHAWDAGLRHDRLWATDVARVAPASVTGDLLTRAFNSPSLLLQEAALKQAAWLNQLPPAAESGFRRLLFRLWASGELARRSQVISVQLRHLRRTTLLSAFRLLRSVMLVDFLLLALIAVCGQLVLGHGFPATIVAAAFAHAMLRLQRAGRGVGGAEPGVDDRVQRRIVLNIYGAFLRFASVVVLGGASAPIGAGADTSVDAQVVVWIAISYQFIWPYAAVGSVLAGDGVPFWKWPLLPPVWIAQKVVRVRVFRVRVFRVRVFRKSPFRQKFRGTGPLPLIILVAGVIVAFLLAIVLFYGNENPPPRGVLVAHAVLGFLLDLSGLFLIAFPIVISFFITRTNVILHRRRREILREARRRTEPYTAREVATALGAFQTSKAVKELVQTLRLTPTLCPPEVIDLFADLLNAAERSDPGAEALEELRTMLTRRPRALSVPLGSGPAFTAWAAEAPKSLRALLRFLDEETLDEITSLITTCRKSR